jgi:hypothetical protein
MGIGVFCGSSVFVFRFCFSAIVFLFFCFLLQQILNRLLFQAAFIIRLCLRRPAMTERLKDRKRHFGETGDLLNICCPG